MTAVAVVVFSVVVVVVAVVVVVVCILFHTFVCIFYVYSGLLHKMCVAVSSSVVCFSLLFHYCCLFYTYVS